METDVETPTGPIAHSETQFVELVLPEQANHYGTLYGANALHMMGKAAFVCATRNAQCPVVMAKADEIEFRRPVRLGEIIDISARIVFQGQYSMTVLVDIAADGKGRKSDTPAISGRFMMVAVDGDGAPIPIPDPERSKPEETCS